MIPPIKNPSVGDWNWTKNRLINSDTCLIGEWGEQRFFFE